MSATSPDAPCIMVIGALAAGAELMLGAERGVDQAVALKPCPPCHARRELRELLA